MIRQPFWPALVLVLVTIGAFGQVVGFDFVDFDDDSYIRDNPHLQGGINRDNLRWAFAADLFYDSPNVDYWQPVTILTRLLDVALYGFHPGGHHLTNLFLHALNASLLFWILLGWTERPWPSFAVALCFAIHPLRAESVAWVVERKDVLSAFFWLLAIQAYGRYVQRPSAARYGLVALSMMIGLMSKPVLVTLPIILLLLDLWPFERFVSGCDRLKTVCRLLAEKLPLLALSIAACWITFHRGQLPLKDSSLSAQLLNAPVAYVWYLSKTFWPAGLAAWYPHEPGTLFSVWKIAGAGVVVLGICFVALRQIRQRPFLAVGWFWFLTALLPMVIGATRIAVADRFSYLAHMGLWIAIVWMIAEAVERFQPPAWACIAGSAAYFSIMFVLTCAQVSFWKDSRTLFEQTLRETRDNYLIHNLMGKTLAEAGNLDDAVAHYREAIQIRPHYDKARYNFANALMQIGRAEDAKKQYIEAIRLNPDHVQARNNFGILLYEMGRPAEAAEQYQEVLLRMADLPAALKNLAWIRATADDRSLRNAEEAVRLAERAAALTDRHQPAILDALAAAYAEAGRYEDAVETQKRSIELARLSHLDDYLPAMQFRLTVYQSGRPYRDAGPHRAVDANPLTQHNRTDDPLDGHSDHMPR